MLSELYIENLAVIEKAAIGFTNNLNIFTGETGAGKSILINGINSILGQRVSKDIVRTGAQKAVVSALFTDLGDNALKKLDELGLELEDGQLFLTREIRNDGRSVARVNERAVSVSLLKEIGNELVNIHGQHDNQILMNPENHIHILDSYAESESLLKEYQKSFKELQKLAKRIKEVKTDEGMRTEKIRRLNEIIDEIEELDISPNEDKEIEEELEVSKNAVAISEALYAVNMILSGDDENDGAAALVSECSDRLSDFTDIMKDINTLYERLSSASIELSDISSEISSLIDSIDADPKRYDYLNQRYMDLKKIMKKYGPELDDVFATLEKSKKELSELGSASDKLSELIKEKNHLLTEVSKKAKELSDFRNKAGEKFVNQVTKELEFLNMPNVKLAVHNESGKLTINGMDNIEFLISANIGELPKPIAKIASGGELSRIMLALKNVLAKKDSIDTLIFDEIDTGVSGRAANKIGQKLKEISRYRQVICVTHLAQIAVKADNHLLIEKQTENERTSTKVMPLDFEGRKREIARIIGGDKITELTLENAEQMLES